MHLNIKICAEGDPPAFPEYAACPEAEMVGMAILEKGMESGNCSVGLLIKDPSGRVCLVQLSASLLVAMGAAARGAKERFGDNDL